MKLLFMCVANSARSQLAEAVAKSIFKNDAQVWSAGSSPKSVHPLTIECLRANHLDYRELRSKSLSELPQEFLKNIDYIITLCAEEVCPVLPNTNAKKLHWPLTDPAASPNLENFQTVLDEIKTRVSKLHQELT